MVSSPVFCDVDVSAVFHPEITFFSRDPARRVVAIPVV